MKRLLVQICQATLISATLENENKCHYNSERFRSYFYVYMTSAGSKQIKK